MAGALMLAMTSHAFAYDIVPVPASGQQLRYERGNAMVVSDANGSIVRILPHANGPHGRMIFTVLAFNKSEAPFNFGYDNVGVSNDKGPVRLFTLEDMRREAVKSARWRAAAVALAAGMQSYSAAQASTYSSSGTVYGQRGMATFTTTGTAYNPALTSLAEGQIQNQAAGDMAAISANLDNYMGTISDHILLITTIDPNTAAGGAVFADRPNYAKGEDRTVKVVVRAGQDTHEFAFTVED
jgi:hypothetical protein